MRTIRTKVYSFKELATDIQDKVLKQHALFLTATIDEDSPFYFVVEEMERLHTPWFITSAIYRDCREAMIEDILANEYEYTKDGKIFHA